MIARLFINGLLRSVFIGWPANNRVRTTKKNGGRNYGPGACAAPARAKTGRKRQRGEQSVGWQGVEAAPDLEFTSNPAILFKKAKEAPAPHENGKSVNSGQQEPVDETKIRTFTIHNGGKVAEKQKRGK